MRQLFAMPWLLSMLMAGVAMLLLYWGTIDGGGGILNFLAAAVLLFVAVRFLAVTRISSGPVAGVDEHLSSGGVVVFWRPGSWHCAQLIRELGAERLQTPYWVNIWAEPEAARRVAEYHEGTDTVTVPTIVTAEGHFLARDTETYDRAKAVIDRAAQRF